VVSRVLGDAVHPDAVRADALDLADGRDTPVGPDLVADQADRDVQRYRAHVASPLRSVPVM
jgi:hypothetical protein